jgi:peptidyl-tRNA hydrolase
MRKVDLSITFVYIIDESLGMSKGKIAAQVSHVAMLLADDYKIVGRAIVLKADHETFMKIFHTHHCLRYILDAGLTEVPAGTMTCLGFRQTEETKQFTKNLRLV